MRLRTKFLLSLVAVISSLTCATLLAVRQTAGLRASQEVRREALGTLHTFQVIQHEHQEALADRDLTAYAAAVGLDVERFEREMVAQTYRDRVRADFMSGVRSGVNGTPSFFINGRRHNDSYDLETLLAAIEAAMVEAVR